MTDSFAQLLRAYRDARALTQEELAELAGITVKAVGALERGERLRPYPHTVRALADALALDDDHRGRLIGSVPGRSRAEAAPPAPAATAHDHSIDSAVSHHALVGRTADLATVVGLLRDPATRVLTLTGPGGVGKTALATAATAEAASAFAGGVARVELGGITDPTLVVATIGAALGVPESGHGGTAAGLSAFVSGRRMLLFLDNLEQVIDCAPDLAELSAHCPDLAIIGTSRSPLRIRAERAVRVEPLGPEESEALFRERADAAGGRVPRSPSEDEAVAEICRRLDGLPLALELAASATALLHPVALLARLDSVLADGPRDLPERQRAMSTTLDWSYDLLGERERTLLAQLSVLPATFSLASAEAVGGPDAVAGLRVLLEHSLVTRAADVHSTERFVLLGPIRQYAAQLLGTDERTSATAALASAMARVARDLVVELRGADLTASLDLAEAELPTVRVAVGHLAQAGRPGAAAELMWHLWPLFALRGRGREGLALLEPLRAAPMSDESRACLHTAAGGMSFVVGEFGGLHMEGERALTLARSAGRPDLIAESAVLAGSGALFAGDLAGALGRFAEGRAILVSTSAPWAEVHFRIGEAQVAMVAGNIADAEAALADSERLARALGNAFSLATVLNLRATLLQLRDEYAEAAQLLAESVDISVGARVSWTFAYALPSLASVAVRLGDLERAATLFGAAASWSADNGVDTGFPTSNALAHRDLTVAREGLGEELFRASWDAGRDTTGAEVVELAHELTHRARG